VCVWTYDDDFAVENGGTMCSAKTGQVGHPQPADALGRSGVFGLVNHGECTPSADEDGGYLVRLVGIFFETAW
jgi:hypothetical protein